MVALSPRFTALAVLCSVAALTLPHADAAVMGIRPAVVRTTHDDPVYVAPPAYGAGSTQNKRFGGAHDSMFATEAIWNARYARRPLSGMAGISFDGQNLPRQGYHDKVVRSVYIEGKEGASYIVKPNKRALSQQHFNSAEWKRQHSAEWKRQEVTGVPGTIEIMSPTADPSHPLQRIASLVLAQANATDSTNGTFVLNASPDDQTQMFMVPMVNATMMFNSTEDVAITLQIPVFDAASAATQAWCATFDPAPPTPASMTAEKCLEPEANGMDGFHKSQVFSFNTVTGAVRPLWANGTSSDADDDSDATAQQSAFVDPQTPDDASIASVTDFEAPIRRQEAQAPFTSSSSSAASSTTSPASTSSVTSAASSTATPSPDFSSGSFGGSPAQDVTLVFVPSEPQINAIAAQDIPSSSASSSIVSATRSASRASSTPSATTSSTAYPTMGSSSTEISTSSTAAAFEDAAVASSSVGSTSAAASSSGSAAPSSISSTMAPQSTLPVFRPLNVEVVPEAVDAEATPTLALPSSGASSSASATASATVASSSTAASASPSVVARADDESATPPYTWMFKRDD